MENLYNMLADSVGALLVGAIFLAALRRKRRGDATDARLLHCLMACCTLVLLTDLPGLLLDGCRFPGARALLWLADTAYWVMQAVYCWLWLLFADWWAFRDRAGLRRRGRVYALPMLLELLMILLTPVTGWVFTIDARNVYIRGSLYLWNMTPYIIHIVAAVAVSLRGAAKSADPERRRRCLSLLVYMFLPVCGVLLDALVYGISWLWPMVALSLLMVYLSEQQQDIAEEQLAAARLQSELTESRVAIMLSQIQPHFLYNALNTVDALCDVDTRAAQKAIRSFAKYLRGNLDAISRKTPVPFREELAHLRQYLTLETFRFDNIVIDYDLQAMDFMLPALSLQPIVENAVKYGVLRKPSGGAVTIATRDRGDYIQLTVQDDGVGFDPETEPEDGRSHIGIMNVRSRLESMCGGALTVESARGVGTIVTYIIPKGGAVN